MPSSSSESPEAASWLYRDEMGLVTTPGPLTNHQKTFRDSASSRLVPSRTCAYKQPSRGRDWAVADATVLGGIASASGPRSYRCGAQGKVILGSITETNRRSTLDSPSRCVFWGLSENQTHLFRERVSVMLPNIDSATAFCVYLMDPVVIWPLSLPPRRTFDTTPHH